MKKLLALLLALTVTIILVGYTNKTNTIIQTKYEIIEVDRIIIQEHLVELTEEQLENIRIIIESDVTIRLENELNHIKYDLEDEYELKLATAIDNLVPIVKWRDKIIKETIYIDKVEYVNTVSTKYVDVIVEVINNEEIDLLTIEYNLYKDNHKFTNEQFSSTTDTLMGMIRNLKNEIAELKS